MSKGSSTKEGISPLSTQIMNQHTAPVLSSSSSSSSRGGFKEKIAKSSTSGNVNDFPNSLAFRVRSALAAHDLDQLNNALDTIEKKSLRFDQPPLSELRASKEIRVRAAAMPSVVSTYYSADKTDTLLIRMIRLGLNPNGEDEYGNTMLMHACKSGHLNLVKFLLTECSDKNKLRLNMFGQNAASLAHKHGNSHLCSLLEQAGIPRHPENPVIKFYLSSFDIADDDSSNSETEEYLDLFEENNFMNLPDENGQTILFHAIIHEDVEFVSFLCKQKRYLNVALHDLNEKSVFDYINQIKNPITRIKLSEQLHSYGRKKAWMSSQDDHSFFNNV
jgi:ankyrin repeat protein